MTRFLLGSLATCTIGPTFHDPISMLPVQGLLAKGQTNPSCESCSLLNRGCMERCQHDHQNNVDSRSDKSSAVEGDDNIASFEDSGIEIKKITINVFYDHGPEADTYSLRLYDFPINFPNDPSKFKSVIEDILTEVRNKHEVPVSALDAFELRWEEVSLTTSGEPFSRLEKFYEFLKSNDSVDLKLKKNIPTYNSDALVEAAGLKNKEFVKEILDQKVVEIHRSSLNSLSESQSKSNELLQDISRALESAISSYKDRQDTSYRQMIGRLLFYRFKLIPYTSESYRNLKHEKDDSLRIVNRRTEDKENPDLNFIEDYKISALHKCLNDYIKFIDEKLDAPNFFVFDSNDHYLITLRDILDILEYSQLDQERSDQVIKIVKYGCEKAIKSKDYKLMAGLLLPMLGTDLEALSVWSDDKFESSLTDEVISQKRIATVSNLIKLRIADIRRIYDSTFFTSFTINIDRDSLLSSVFSMYLLNPLWKALFALTVSAAAKETSQIEQVAKTILENVNEESEVFNIIKRQSINKRWMWDNLLSEFSEKLTTYCTKSIETGNKEMLDFWLKEWRIIHGRKVHQGSMFSSNNDLEFLSMHDSIESARQQFQKWFTKIKERETSRRLVPSESKILTRVVGVAADNFFSRSNFYDLMDRHRSLYPSNFYTATKQVESFRNDLRKNYDEKYVTVSQSQSPLPKKVRINVISNSGDTDSLSSIHFLIDRPNEPFKYNIKSVIEDILKEVCSELQVPVSATDAFELRWEDVSLTTSGEPFPKLKKFFDFLNSLNAKSKLDSVDLRMRKNIPTYNSDALVEAAGLNNMSFVKEILDQKVKSQRSSSSLSESESDKLLQDISKALESAIGSYEDRQEKSYHYMINLLLRYRSKLIPYASILYRNREKDVLRIVNRNLDYDFLEHNKIEILRGLLNDYIKFNDENAPGVLLSFKFNSNDHYLISLRDILEILADSESQLDRKQSEKVSQLVKEGCEKAIKTKDSKLLAGFLPKLGTEALSVLSDDKFESSLTDEVISQKRIATVSDLIERRIADIRRNYDSVTLFTDSLMTKNDRDSLLSSVFSMYLLKPLWKTLFALTVSAATKETSQIEQVAKTILENVNEVLNIPHTVYQRGTWGNLESEFSEELTTYCTKSIETGKKDMLDFWLKEWMIIHGRKVHRGSRKCDPKSLSRHDAIESAHQHFHTWFTIIKEKETSGRLVPSESKMLTRVVGDAADEFFSDSNLDNLMDKNRSLYPSNKKTAIKQVESFLNDLRKNYDEKYVTVSQSQSPLPKKVRINVISNSGDTDSLSSIHFLIDRPNDPFKYNIKSVIEDILKEVCSELQVPVSALDAFELRWEDVSLTTSGEPNTELQEFYEFLKSNDSVELKLKKNIPTYNSDALVEAAGLNKMSFVKEILDQKVKSQRSSSSLSESESDKLLQDISKALESAIGSYEDRQDTSYQYMISRLLIYRFILVPYTSKLYRKHEKDDILRIVNRRTEDKENLDLNILEDRIISALEIWLEDYNNFNDKNAPVSLNDNGFVFDSNDHYLIILQDMLKILADSQLDQKRSDQVSKLVKEGCEKAIKSKDSKLLAVFLPELGTEALSVLNDDKFESYLKREVISEQPSVVKLQNLMYDRRMKIECNFNIMKVIHFPASFNWLSSEQLHGLRNDIYEDYILRPLFDALNTLTESNKGSQVEQITVVETILRYVRVVIIEGLIHSNWSDEILVTAETIIRREESVSFNLKQYCLKALENGNIGMALLLLKENMYILGRCCVFEEQLQIKSRNYDHVVLQKARERFHKKSLVTWERATSGLVKKGLLTVDDSIKFSNIVINAPMEFFSKSNQNLNKLFKFGYNEPVSSGSVRLNGTL